MESMILIDYPETRRVSEERLRMWYADAVANGDCDPGAETLKDVCDALEDCGHISVANPARVYCPDCGARGETRGHQACQYPTND